MNDVALNKKESIERCVRQIRSYYSLPAEIDFMEDRLKQDAIAINMQRACEQSIDLANHAIKIRKMGLPKDSRDSFRLLAQNGIIPEPLADKLCRMIGFRNVLVHEYQAFDIRLMVDVIENRLDDLLVFSDLLLKAFP
jgi:uncharacterized protein YutE (UPF0331/DUF86 family)